jgi:hypothetical protein
MSETRPGQNSRWIPSLSEMVFVSVMAWLFLGASGPEALLTDGDTGWHIRTGDYILATHSFPKQDLFSFSKPDQPWFAWEWLSDVIFAGLHKFGGLAGVVLLAGVLIAATSAVMLRYMVWQRSDLFVSIVVMLVASSASTVHWLARPHLFSYFFLAIAIWLLEADRQRPTRWVFALVGLCLAWTNLHGGFLALLSTLAIYLLGSAVETVWNKSGPQGWAQTKRYGLLFGLASAATLVNPYTYHLHRHIVEFLRSDFILQHVAEFQSPNFRGEGMRYFEVMLFAGLAAVPALLRRKDVTQAFLLLFWAHAALLSGRHVLLYVVVAAPVVAREATQLWERAAKAGIGWLATLKQVADDYAGGCFHPAGGTGRRRAIAWMAPVCVVAMGATLFAGQRSERLRSEFPKTLFPVDACTAAESQFAGRRIFTSDQWADYLIYRYYPKIKVFIDGRSDFYGPQLGNEYIRAMNSDHAWAQIFDRYRFDLALLPVQWPLATTIKANSNWKVRYDDGKALLLERTGPLALNPPETAAAAQTGGETGKS